MLLVSLVGHWEAFCSNNPAFTAGVLGVQKAVSVSRTRKVPLVVPAELAHHQQSTTTLSGIMYPAKIDIGRHKVMNLKHLLFKVAFQAFDFGAMGLMLVPDDED